jgi:hypothetical protein
MCNVICSLPHRFVMKFVGNVDLLRAVLTASLSIVMIGCGSNIADPVKAIFSAAKAY